MPSLTWQIARGWPLRQPYVKPQALLRPGQAPPVHVACQSAERIRSHLRCLSCPLAKSLEFEIKVLSTLGSGKCMQMAPMCSFASLTTHQTAIFASPRCEAMSKPSTPGCEAISSLAMIKRACLHTRAQRRALSVQRQLESLESEWSI
jgi:hypothetical protein